MPDYQPLEILGQGQFGEVWLAHDRALGVDRALKFIALTGDQERHYTEAQLMERLSHENVVQVFDAGPAEHGIYISMEYLPRGSAAEEAQSCGFVPFRRAQDLLEEALRGLQYLHHQHYVHADIKPSNIMVGDDGRAKLADFGLVKQLRGDGYVRHGGAYRMHRAPETLETGNLSVLTDIYQAGVTYYRLINGDAMLGWPDEPELTELILQGEYPDRYKFQPFVTETTRRVVRKSLSVDPSARYQSADEFRYAIEASRSKADFSLVGGIDGAIWFGSSDTHELAIELTPTKVSFSVQTRYGRRGSVLRTKKDHSFANIPAKSVESKVRPTLQAFARNGHL